MEKTRETERLFWLRGSIFVITLPGTQIQFNLHYIKALQMLTGGS